jgi:hypothetical protein
MMVMTEPPVAARRVPPAPGEIRPLGLNDVPGVAHLFQKTFHRIRRSSRAALEACLRELFLRHPGYDPDCASRVYVGADGAVRGFIGVLPMPMLFRGRPLRAAIASSLMVENPHEDPMAGARLLKSFFAGPQDFSFSETSNPLAQRMWERLGGRAAATYSMEWVRVLRPAGAALALAGERIPGLRVLHRAGARADRLAARFAPGLTHDEPLPPHSETVEVGDIAAADVLPRFADSYALRPAWTTDLLRWQLGHAERKEKFGELVRCLVVGRNDAVLGCFLYYVRRDGIAYVLQTLAHAKTADTVVGHLFAHAGRRGAVALRGRAQPDLLDPLLRRRCLMLHRSSTTVSAADPEVLDAVARGDALLTGLAGESWTRLIGGILQ